MHDFNIKIQTFINSVYMSINFSISSIVVLLMGAFGDVIGLDTTYEIATVMAFIAIVFAFKVKKS